LSPHIPIPIADGARHAVTNVERSASVADAPCACACVKCDFKICVAAALRASDAVSAISVDTKSAMAASGCDDDQLRAFGCCAVGLASTTIAATDSQMFSRPAGASSVG